MTTKQEFEKKIEDLEIYIKGLQDERGMFHTELLKLAVKSNISELLEFLNPTPEELIDVRELINAES